MSSERKTEQSISCEDAGSFFSLHYALKETLFDILIVKETTGGIYYGERGRLDAPCAGSFAAGGRCSKGCQEAYDTEKYSWIQIERVLRAAYGFAAERHKKLTIADKADILESSRLWREVAEEVSKDFPQVVTNFIYIDKAAADVIIDPCQFDVIVTSNLFGDILFSVLSALTNPNRKSK